MLAHLTPPRRASDPSPGPRRLVKAPVAVHPLPLGEGKNHALPLNPLPFTLYPLPSPLPAVVRSLSRSVSTFSGVRSS